MASAHPEIEGLVDWQPLARGGFSSVWQARQESLDRLVAVKVDHRTLSEDKERRRFLREAGAAGRLSGHIGIVTVHDAGILSDGRPYLVMDLCPGGSLTQWLKPEGRKSQRRVRDVGVRIADALAAAHARGVLHRDVKPANILIDAYDHPGLADFGLAAMPEAGVELSVTLEGMTPAYAPREVFYLEPPTEFGDVYSLAATLYALLDGKPPRWPDTGTPSLPQLLELQRLPIERLPHVDDEFMDVLLAAMNDDATQRPTAAQFRDQLAELTFAPTVNTDTQVVRSATRAAGVAPAAAVALDDDSENGETAKASVGGRSGGSGLRRRRSLLLVLLAAAVVAALVVVGLFHWGSAGTAAPIPVPAGSTDPGGSNSDPSISSTPSSPKTSSHAESPTPKPPKAPDGFIDCSKQFGGKSYCVDPKQPECWDNATSLGDHAKSADMRNCRGYHLEQTFVAGQLPEYISSQSKFEAQRLVVRLCNKTVLNRVLAKDTALKDWQVQALPEQPLIQDSLFRCLVSAGTRTKPFQLKVPAS